MLTAASQVAQDVRLVTAYFFECIGQNRQSVEGTLLVDGIGQLLDGGREPARDKADGAEGKWAEDAADCVAEGAFPPCLYS